jgi:hypothetical protein
MMERDPHDPRSGGAESAEERNLLAGLERRFEPPPSLEDRVVGELSGQGLLGASPAPTLVRSETPGSRRVDSGRARTVSRRRHWVLPLAASLFGLAVGWGLATRSVRGGPAAADQGRLFVLMFYGGPQDGEELARSIRANGDWAHNVLADRFLGGRKLLPEGTLLAAGQPARAVAEPQTEESAPVGFFLIRARDLEEATALGRGSPHLAFGGQLSVRPVDNLDWVYRPGTGSSG